MQGERGRHPVVGLDAAIVVRVEVGHVAGLVQGVLLEVEARGVDVGTEDVQALLHGTGAQVDEHERFVVTDGVDLVPRLELAALGDAGGEVDVTCSLGELDGGGHALALGLVLADEGAVLAAEVLELGEGHIIIFLPSVRSLHEEFLSIVQIYPQLW